MHTTSCAWREVYICELITTINAINVFITSKNFLPLLLLLFLFSFCGRALNMRPALLAKLKMYKRVLLIIGPIL